MTTMYLNSSSDTPNGGRGDFLSTPTFYVLQTGRSEGGCVAILPGPLGISTVHRVGSFLTWEGTLAFMRPHAAEGSTL